MDYDFALIQLTKPLRFTKLARPISLPDVNEDPPAGLNVFISGWGETLDDTVDRDMLRAIELPIVSRKLCNERWEAVIGQELGNIKNVITERMICAASNVPGKCLRDVHSHSKFNFMIQKSTLATVTAAVPWFEKKTRF